MPTSQKNLKPNIPHTYTIFSALSNFLKGSSPSLPIIPQLDQRAPSSESVFTFHLGQRQSSYDRVLADITNMTPNFAYDPNQKMFFPTEFGQSHADISSSGKPGPIMVMDQYKLSSIPEKPYVKDSLLKENYRRSIDPQGYTPSLETMGTSHDVILLSVTKILVCTLGVEISSIRESESKIASRTCKTFSFNLEFCSPHWG